MDDELRELLEAVLRQAPAARTGLAEFLRERGGVLSERVLAVALRRGLIRPFQAGEETGAAPGFAARIAVEEAYVLTREGAIALGRSDDADLYT